MHPSQAIRLVLACAATLLLLPAIAHAQLAPTAETGAAEPGVYDAVVSGKVNPNGTVTRYRFEYGTTTAYGSATSEAQTTAGTEPQPVKATLSGLSESTKYYYRLVAFSPGGTKLTGESREFTTKKSPVAPTPPSVTRLRISNRTTTSATLTARIDPNRAASTWWVEWGTDTGLRNRTPTQTVPAADTNIEISYALDNLPANKKIYWRIVAENSAGKHEPGHVHFTTNRDVSGITLQTSQKTVSFGGPVSVSGKIAGAGVGGITVVLESAEFPFNSYAEVGRARTGSSGTFRFSSRTITTATRFRAYTVAANPLRSDTLHVNSRAKIDIRQSNRTRRYVFFTGKVKPTFPQGRVTLQRRTQTGGWKMVRRARLIGGDEYSIRVFRKQRLTTYRVKVTPDDGGAHVSGVSSPRAVAKKI